MVRACLFALASSAALSGGCASDPSVEGQLGADDAGTPSWPVGIFSDHTVAQWAPIWRQYELESDGTGAIRSLLCTGPGDVYSIRWRIDDADVVWMEPTEGEWIGGAKLPLRAITLARTDDCADSGDVVYEAQELGRDESYDGQPFFVYRGSLCPTGTLAGGFPCTRPGGVCGQSCELSACDDGVAEPCAQ